MKYTVKYEVMPAQTNARGKTKLDRFGQPLCSVRIKQSKAQKTNMLESMLTQYKMWQTSPELWGQDKHYVGNDPVQYTPEQMFQDFHSKLRDWSVSIKNDVFKSFVDRHNYLMDLYIQTVYHMRRHLPQHYADLELFDTLRIELEEHQTPFERMTQVIETNSMFEMKKQ